MYDRRALHLARLAGFGLVLVSLVLVYWQAVRGAELNPVAFQTAWSERGPGEAGAGQGQPNQDFLRGVSQAVDLEGLPAPVVQRTVNLLNGIRRGTIYDRGGRELALDRSGEDGAWERFYTEPSLAHVLGYVSGLRIGVAGLELSYNQTLLGLDRPDAQIDLWVHRAVQGSDLVLTVDTAIQRAADGALRDRRGAVVVLDARSGAVLAMASSPRFDPNRVNEPGYLGALLEGCGGQAGGESGCAGALINRASQSAYAPGSTWKTVTLIAALDSGQAQPGTVFDFGEPVQGPDGAYYIYSVDGGVIPDPNHQEAQLDLEMSYAKSANVTFARLGDEMPPDTLLRYARQLGFGDPGEIRFPLEIEYTPSQVAWDADTLYSNNLLRAATAIGQGEVLTSPLNVGMVVLAVLNDGRMPVPHLVQFVHQPDGRFVHAAGDRPAAEPVMQPQTARAVRQMMLTTVERGTGRLAAVPGLVVGGKTGTAQVGDGQPPHAWFAGFAESGERGVVIVVLIENGGEGSQAAAPVFAEIAAAALAQPGEEALPQPAPTPVPEATQPAQPAPTEAVPTPELPAEPTPAVPTEIPTLTATAPPVQPGVPTPEITRDPAKKDITAENPSCGLNQEVPQATGEFLWPSPYQALSGGNFREGHPGLDLAAVEGSPVYAADTGLVVFAGWSGIGYGNTVMIDHGNGFRTLYAHLSQVSTHCGAKVTKGKIIGLSGNTGNSSGPHLHFEVRVPGGYIDPVTVLPVP